MTWTFATCTADMATWRFVFHTLQVHLIITRSNFFLFCKEEDSIELPQETVPEMDLSPVLFEDSPSSSPCLIHEGAAGDGVFEVFGKSIEEAVREMRFRIEQKTMLTASAGQEKLCIIFYYIHTCVYILYIYVLKVPHLPSVGNLVFPSNRVLYLFFFFFLLPYLLNKTSIKVVLQF